MKPLIVANWKANKTIQETTEWVSQAKLELESIKDVEVVICPSFTSIPTLNQLLAGSSIKIGAQNVSDHPSGAFTGEVSAELLSGLASYCIVGHSERRRLYNEKESDSSEKINRLLEFKITPILCVSDISQMNQYLDVSPTFQENSDKIIFVYEPPSAISGGGNYRPETPEEADQNAKKIGEKLGKKVATLYGGSVSETTVASFLAKENINGVLVGKASLEPKSFIELTRASRVNMI